MAERHGTNSKHPRRRLAARRPVAAYGRTVQRCLLLILIASAPFLIGERPQSWDALAGAGALAHVAAFLKFDARSIFAIIGITSPWILPMVGRSARVRGAFLLGSVAVHALLCQLFYVDFVCGLPNSVDALLGTVGVPGHEGGPLGFLSWGRVHRQERTRATVTPCLARVGPTTPKRRARDWGRRSIRPTRAKVKASHRSLGQPLAG
jgi:hypothetical protein